MEENARALAQRVDQVLAQTGSEKLHLIAHSKGGLDARYHCSTLGYGDKIASVNLVSAPNRGNHTMDAIYHLSKWMFRLCGFFVNVWYRFIGDKNPDFCSVCFQFTTAWAEEFNRQNPDAPAFSTAATPGP